MTTYAFNNPSSNTWTFSPNNPSGGNAKDCHLNTTTGDLYYKETIKWNKVATLVLPTTVPPSGSTNSFTGYEYAPELGTAGSMPVISKLITVLTNDSFGNGSNLRAPTATSALVGSFFHVKNQSSFNIGVTPQAGQSLFGSASASVDTDVVIEPSRGYTFYCVEQPTGQYSWVAVQ